MKKIEVCKEKRKFVGIYTIYMNLQDVEGEEHLLRQVVFLYFSQRSKARKEILTGSTGSIGSTGLTG